jgi:Rps23 Pro-64 3,4-dihydroxylase Tpa1-like proline 4-hydroxylase
MQNKIMDRHHLADIIYNNLLSQKERIEKQYEASKGKIGYFFIDNLLPNDIALKIYSAFPKPENTKMKKSLREYKYVAAQMDNYDPILEETVYAFQDSRIVKFIGEICEIPKIFPDENLYAGGISMMGYENFLNPHLDNSHDKDRNHWRVLNLLYYVTPEWEEKFGGNLEIWPDGIKNAQTTIHSKFNRLAVMATHGGSWHSVSPVTKQGVRCCVSNYYFSPEPLHETDSFHVTSFRGRPDQPVRDVILESDNILRSTIRKFFKKGIVENPHVYKKK